MYIYIYIYIKLMDFNHVCFLGYILIFIFEKNFSIIEKVIATSLTLKKIFLKLKNLICALMTH